VPDAIVVPSNNIEVGRGMAAARAKAPETGVERRLTALTRKAMPVALGQPPRWPVRACCTGCRCARPWAPR
jgi:hypothetical protein